VVSRLTVSGLSTSSGCSAIRPTLLLVCHVTPGVAAMLQLKPGITGVRRSLCAT
jgi:hypothetical protein